MIQENCYKKEKIKNTRRSKFVLMIAGEAKSGKSSFINAFLGKEILPTSVRQCTNSIIKIKYGEKLSLILKHMNGSRMVTNFDKIKQYLKEGASVNDKYRDLPVFLINKFILKNVKNINENMIKILLKVWKKKMLMDFLSKNTVKESEIIFKISKIGIIQ